MIGEIVQEVKTPIHGMLFTLREYPVVSCGSLIARVLEATAIEKRKNIHTGKLLPG